MAKKICGNCFSEIRGHKCRSCGHDERLAAKEYDALPVGTVIGSGYVIGKVIGRGGFGIIYIAYDPLNDRTCAVKEYFPDGIAVRMENNIHVEPMTSFQTDSFSDGLDTFVNEAITISKFRECSEIIGVYDSFKENGTAYYVMEYCNGISLMEYVEKYGVISAGQAVYIAKRILPALSVLHRNGTLHRDVSPENIMLCNNDKVRLIDFGSARKVDSAGGYTVVLKAGFAPLEQYRRFAEQDGRADIYSLGTSLYYALTKKVPNDPISRVDDDSAFVEGLTALPQTLADILRKTSAIKADDRYALAEDLLCDFIKCDIYEETIPLNLTPDISQKTDKSHKIPHYLLTSAAAFVGILCAGIILSGIYEIGFANQLPAEQSVTSESKQQENIPEYIIIDGSTIPTTTERLDLSGRGLTDDDIKDLRYMTNLVNIILDDNELTDLSPLSELVNLEGVHFSNNIGITDIDFVKNLTNLTKITGEYTEVKDLSPLEGKTKLRYVFFGDTQVTDISPIAGASGLSKVGFNRCNIENIDALADKPDLEMVCLTGCGLKSIEPLANSKRLKYVYLSLNRLTDISALAGCYCTNLYLDYNYLSDTECFKDIAVMDCLRVYNTGFDDDDIKQLLRMVNGTYCYYYTEDANSLFCGDRSRLDDIEMMNREGL